MKKLIAVLALALLGAGAVAASGVGDAQGKRLSEALTRAVGAPPDAIRATPLPEVFEATYGTQVFYISGDGRYVFEGGQLLDLEAGRNLTSQRRTERRGAMVAALKDEDLIVFAPPKPKYTVTVFTDVDCPYCHRMHREIAEHNKRGIAVRYAAYSGPGARSYDKMVSVWCAKDRQAAITAAKAGREVAEAKCDNPVQRQGELGAALGVTGTPSVVLADGRLLPGYVTPAQLEGILNGSIQP